MGPALNHYRCVRCYFPKTRSERICDTVQFLSHQVKFPEITTDDYLKQAVDGIISLLTVPPSSTTPSLSAGDPVCNALLTLAEQLKRTQPVRKTNANENGSAQSPRVHQYSSSTSQSPRMKQLPPPPSLTSVMHKTSPYTLSPNKSYSPVVRSSNNKSLLEYTTNIPKNARFRNRRSHRYPLRSLTRNHQCQHIFTVDGKKQFIDALLSGTDKHSWLQSLSNERDRLAQGNSSGVKGTDTIRFIFRNKVPKGRSVTYATFVCDYKPLKDEKHRVRITVGGDKLFCPKDTGSPTANILETKILLNSTISNAHRGARFISVDLRNFFLATPMGRAEYMKVNLRHLPHDIVEKYNLEKKVTSDGYVYILIQKWMYGLRNAAILAYNHLKEHLKTY